MTKITTDVAIIAAGPSGLCAAVAAAEEGVKVAVFEKAAIAGGTANMGMGPFGVESRLQKRSMISLTKEEAFKQFMDYVHWQSDPHLVHDYFWNSGPTIDWLEDMGVVFAGAMRNFPQSAQTWHVVQPEDGSRPGARAAGTMNKVVYQRAVELGVEFYFNTPAYEILKDGDKVCGLKARNDKGEEFEVESKAVIVATGGFGTNPEMVKEYTGYTLRKDMFDFEVPGIVGDGIKMAWAAGAGHGRMEMERTMGCPLPGVALGERPQARAFMQATPIAINKSGYRVCDESVMQNSAVAGNIVDYQQDRTVYMVISDSIIRHFKQKGIDYPTEVFHDDPLENFQEAWKTISNDYPDIAYMAESAEGLAEKIGLPVENFLETVDQYNEFCEQNLDDDFGKAHRYLVALTGKFYALRVSCGAYGSLGGIKINHKLQVITDDYKVIPGFYGAGADVCELYNGTYYFYLPGNTMGFAVTSGRMAGGYAAEYVQSLEE